MGELGLKEGSEISVYHSSSPTYGQTYGAQTYGQGRDNNTYGYISQDYLDTAADSAKTVPLVGNVASSLSNNDARFSCLLDLCDSVASEEVLRELWWLIGMIPTQAQLYTAFDTFRTSSESEKAPSHGWKQFFYSGEQATRELPLLRLEPCMRYRHWTTYYSLIVS